MDKLAANQEEPINQEEPTVESRLAYEGRLLDLRVHTVRLAGGRVSVREIAESKDAVCVVAVDDDGCLYLVRQYRKAVERSLLELPAGAIDPGEEPIDAAHRELREETGLLARTMEPLSFFYTCPGFCTEGMHAFFAGGLSQGADSQDVDENIEVVKVPLESAPSLIAKGEILDAKSIASLMLALGRR